MVDTHETARPRVWSGRVHRLLRRGLTSQLGLLAATGLAGFAAAVVITFSRGWPAIPSVHDEASILLAADTFASGRLTNPTPPLPEHFETFHVLVEPTYASKYPPAQGLMLAVGQVLAGTPIVGVWLSAGIFCAVLTWALLAWFPPSWALWGTFLILFMLVGGGSQQGYWLSTYWGGLVAATGAALVYGGVKRFTRAPSVPAAVLFALGLGTLALSRPFEGLLVAIPAVTVAVVWLLRDKATSMAARLRRVAAPCAIVLTTIALFALVYNYRVTGNALRLPYMEYEAQYSNIPLFLISGGAEPPTTYANDEMRRFYRRQHEARREKNQSPGALLRTEYDRSSDIKDLLAPGLTLILLVAALSSRHGRSLLLPVTGTLLVLSGALAVTWYFPHYIAPGIPPWAILLTAGAERLASIDAPSGRMGRLMTSVILAVAAVSAFATPFQLRDERPSRSSRWYVQRDSLARQLEATGRRHLVLVSYGPKHSAHDEWVYNAARLTESAVLWARSLTPEKDARLIHYFRDRVPWAIRVDSSAGPFRLRAIANSTNAELTEQ